MKKLQNKFDERGAYFRVTKSFDNLPIGTLLLIWVEEGEIHAQVGETTYVFDEAELVNKIEECPRGREEQMAKLTKLLQESQTPPDESVPQLLIGSAPESTSQALITTQNRSTLTDAKKEALLAKKKVEVIKTEIQGLLAEQQKSLELAAKQWETKLNNLNYAISSINLYLGRDEEIVCIQEGEVADKEEPVTIRQTVLYMDEETALNVEDGGLDFETLADFDKWVCQPENLQQLLPESKGILGMKLRRDSKFYANADVWDQIMMEMANGGTYILVRNGQRLWRIWNDIDLPEHLFPSKEEFNQLFYDRWNKDPLRPGSRGYQAAMQQAKGLQKRYFQVVLLLQGLLDRTQIFKPLPVERVNLLDPNPDPSLIRLIRDAENLLGDGRPDFQDWLRGLNAKLEPGKRIVFGGTEYMRYQHESRKENYSLTRPKFCEWPAHLAIYSIKSKQGQELTFSYPRKQVKAHASFVFSRSDDLVLNFDDATEADIRYYLADRCNRHHYLSSFPVLNAALALKQKEQSTEQPFVDLLTREVTSKLKVPAAKAECLIKQIIPWWKQKNQISRNLTADEKAAYKQILKEAEIRLDIERAVFSESGVHNLGAQPDCLAVGISSDSTITAVFKHPGYPALARREDWSLDVLTKLSVNDWWMPDAEAGRWKICWQSPEWSNWTKSGRRQDFLSEPEVQTMFTELQSKLKNSRKEMKQLAAITWGPGGFYVYGLMHQFYFGGGADEWQCQQWRWNEKRELSQGHQLSCDMATEEENPNIVENNEDLFDHERSRLKELRPEVQKLPFTAYGSILLFWDETAFQASLKVLKIKQHKRNQEDAKRHRLQSLLENVSKEIDNRFWSHEKKKYLEDGGVEELWEDHAKTVKVRRFDLRETDLEVVLAKLLRTKPIKDIIGLSISAAFELARQTNIVLEHVAGNKALPGNIILTLD